MSLLGNPQVWLVTCYVSQPRQKWWQVKLGGATCCRTRSPSRLGGSMMTDWAGYSGDGSAIKDCSKVVLLIAIRHLSWESLKTAGNIPFFDERVAKNWQLLLKGDNRTILWLNSIHYIHLGMDQYLLIPFLGGWTSIYQLFWGSLGTRVLTHPHLSKFPCFFPNGFHDQVHPAVLERGRPRQRPVVTWNPLRRAMVYHGATALEKRSQVDTCWHYLSIYFFVCLFTIIYLHIYVYIYIIYTVD